ncbi:MAG: ABC transporter substrate-binding protein [Lachnospiraceae bacterium]|nr:ABC transporter substrate-binding protein [Lachnospiraceae bacterium]
MMFITSCASQGVTSVSQGSGSAEETQRETADSPVPDFETSDPETSVSEISDPENDAGQEEAAQSWLVDIDFEGGTGKSYIKSPVAVSESDGKLTATFIWSSVHYDYMIVGGQKYDNENPGGESTFTIPVDTLEGTLTVIGDTTAMSTPHEIEYVITWGDKRKAEKTGNDANTEDPADQGDHAVSDMEDTDREQASFEESADAQIETIREEAGKALEDDGLSLSETLPLSYAKGFSVETYEGYHLISIANSGVYLTVPKGEPVPEKLPKEVVIMQMPMDHAYLASTSAMDLIDTCGALDHISLSGTAEKDWYIENAKKAMQEGKILYAGKYRAPDYELLLTAGCDLAIENTMIYHEPAVKEQLTQLGIPVLVETSSYEEHPLGRLEWIKLYGVLFDRKKEAQEYFTQQLALIGPLLSETTDTGKSVVFFHVTANGLINVRKQGDYITKMIELSGGHYALSDTGESDNALSTMNMQMEDFYAQAYHADIIIYNSTIGGEITSVDELIKMNPLFADFKAVKESQVYCSKRNLFQQITGMGQFMQDLRGVLGNAEGPYTYLNKLK